MRADFAHGMVWLNGNRKGTDTNKVNKMLKLLEDAGYSCGADESEEGIICYAICAPMNTTIKEMKEDYAYLKGQL